MMIGWGAFRHTLLTLGMVLLLGVIGPGYARADITFPTQIPKTSDALSAIIKAVPGLDAAGIKNFKASRTSASAKLKINSPLKKALLTGFHSTAKHNATKAVSPSSETMRTI